MPRMTAAAAAAPDRELFHQHRETPFQHFRIGQAGVGHVRLDGVGAWTGGRGPAAAGDGFVIAETRVAEQHVVHRAAAGRLGGAGAARGNVS